MMRFTFALVKPINHNLATLANTRNFFFLSNWPSLGQYFCKGLDQFHILTQKGYVWIAICKGSGLSFRSGRRIWVDKLSPIIKWAGLRQDNLGLTYSVMIHEHPFRFRKTAILFCLISFPHCPVHQGELGWTVAPKGKQTNKIS